MTLPDLAATHKTLAELPRVFAGPGGVAAVLHEGKVIAQSAWGHVDLAQHRPMTAATRLPICSISKQFTCAVLLAQNLDQAQLDQRLAALLPDFRDPAPSIAELCHNQSGLRDYWALTVLHGARAEQSFSRQDLTPLLARMQRGHFAAGSRYSYCNLNYRLLADLIEGATGTPLETLYRRHIWTPAGMEDAVLTTDTRRPEDAVIGYEGNEQTGWFPAQNGITWIGDAGISASLADMIAYEAWIDATRADPTSLYARISAPVAFRDGTPAQYGYGLRHMQIAGFAATGHGGALRGFRCFRLTLPEPRLSVVVMFNHESDAQGAALSLARAALTGSANPAPAAAVPASWAGLWQGAETGLLARISSGDHARLHHYATLSEGLAAADGGLTSAVAKITRAGEVLNMQRPLENLSEPLHPVAAPDLQGQASFDEMAGRYDAPELRAEMHITCRGGAAHVWFRGYLGEGQIEPLQPAGKDLWLVQTRRSMDAPAPGDWTLELLRDDQGQITGARLGCWLARGIIYTKA